MAPISAVTCGDACACEVAADQDQERDRLTRDLEKAERDIRCVIEAIKAGVPGEAVRDEMAVHVCIGFEPV